ncbi:Uncharacterized protein SCF082_LOCUS48992 [Durusdinium trenchii]|uniref:Uncharacterized protein n=1 Tax=Durusdinium trenchii TaxID=1381693 RepID=A0ABP0RZ20_9DINO
MEPLKKEDEDMKEALKEDPDATPGNPSAREMLWEAFLKVTEDKNLGEWLNEKYPEKQGFANAIQRIVWGRMSDDMPGLVNLIPNDWPDEDLNSEDLSPLLLSLRFFKAIYRHQSDPASYIYDALRVGHETSEKQAPSALEFLGQFRKAIDLQKVSSGKSLSLSTALQNTIADYNKTVVRKYRVDGPKKKVILNLMRSPGEFVQLLSDHYDKFKHTMPAGLQKSIPKIPRGWMRKTPSYSKPKHSVFERVPRTTVQLNAVIAHGFGVQLFLSEEHSMPARVERDERLPRRYQPSATDVFCLIKQDLCNDALAQPAMLVWPGDTHNEVRTFWQNAVNHPGVQTDLDPERAADLLEFSEALEKYPQYGRAVYFLRQLTGEIARERHNALPIEFLAAGGHAPRHDIVRELPQREERPNPYRMNVRFHR